MFYVAAQMSISDVHIHLKKITYKHILSLWCVIIVYNLWLLSMFITHVVCVITRLSVLKLPGIHSQFNTLIYLQFYLSIYTLGGRGNIIKQPKKNATRGSVIFPATILQISRLLCRYHGNTITHDIFPCCHDGKMLGVKHYNAI